jgi:hypothetical protein
MTTCENCLYRIRHAVTNASICNNPEALRYRQNVGQWTCCPDYSSEAAE